MAAPAMAQVVNTVPPWVLSGQAEEADLAPEAQAPSDGNRRPRRAGQTADEARVSDELVIPRAESPETQDEHDLPPAPDGPETVPTSPRLPGTRSSSAQHPQQSSSSNPMRARLHRLRQRLSEHHAEPDSPSPSSDSGVVNDDFDPDYEDISDDEIHTRRDRAVGRGASRHASTALDRCGSLEQSRNPRGRDGYKDEWQAATLLLSPAERRRLGREIRTTLAQSGSYWAKRRQRRRLRQQMRHGGGASDPRDSFQPMNLTIEAAETFGARAFTGHDPPSRRHRTRIIVGVQHPGAPLLPVPMQYAADGGSRFPHLHLHPPNQHTPLHPHLMPVASHPSSGTSSGPVPEANRSWPSVSPPSTPDPSRAHLVRMSGLSTSFPWDGQEELPRWEKEVFTRRRASDERWNVPWRPQVAMEALPPMHQDPGAGGPWHRRPRFGSAGEENPGFGYGYGSKSKKMSGRYASWSWWRGFLLHHPFAPLFVRTINLVITTCTLAVAIRERQSLRRMGVENIVGVSPLLGIIFCPLTLAHIFFQVWLEYFGRPIGLWSVRSKLFGTSIEIIFVGMWSAEMALAWDNYFTTPNDELNPNGRAYIRRLQCFLIGLAFISLFAYMITLILSLFRIFVRVTGSEK